MRFLLGSIKVEEADIFRKFYCNPWTWCTSLFFPFQSVIFVTIDKVLHNSYLFLSIFYYENIQTYRKVERLLQWASMYHYLDFTISVLLYFMPWFCWVAGRRADCLDSSLASCMMQDKLLNFSKPVFLSANWE